jgi:oligoendopeptidase F
MTTKNPLHWDLSNVYPGLESAELAAAMQSLREQASGVEQALRAAPGPQDSTAALTAAAHELIERFNSLLGLSRTVRSYIHSYVSTDSYNTTASRLMSQFDQIGVAIQQQSTRFESWIGQNKERVDEIIAQDDLARAHAFFLKESAEQSRYLMDAKLEDLAAELNLSGGNAWQKLQVFAVGARY